MASAAQAFVQSLADFPPMPGVFNPWSQQDERDQPGVDAARIRRTQLQTCIDARRTCAKVILVAEALSCRGGRFTGTAMTSERILLGNDAQLNSLVHAAGLDAGIALLPGPCVRTSNANALSEQAARKNGVYEKTASVVWRTMLLHGFLPTDFALWNAFPFHPFRGIDTQSNRPPTPEEMQATARILMSFLRLFSPCVELVALGRDAESALTRLAPEREFALAKHPAARKGKLTGATSSTGRRPMHALDDVIRKLSRDVRECASTPRTPEGRG